MLALSIRRPWPWAILHLPPELRKDVENRDWPTTVRGKFLIHASKGCTKAEYRDGCTAILEAQMARYEQLLAGIACQGLDSYPPPLQMPAPLSSMPAGAIVGWSEILDCVDRSDSPWFSGRYGFVLGRRGVLEPIPCRGALGFFRVPDDVAQAVSWQATRSGA